MPSTGTLFSGDAIYDGPLLDELPESDIVVYLNTMERLCERYSDHNHLSIMRELADPHSQLSTAICQMAKPFSGPTKS